MVGAEGLGKRLTKRSGLRKAKVAVARTQNKAGNSQFKVLYATFY